MKILYLSTWDFTDEISDGVCKKIKSQISVFEKQGYQVDITYIKQGTIIYRQDGIEKKIGSVGAIKKTPAYIKMYQHLKDSKYDWIYNRYGMMDTFYYRLLKRLHKNGAKILIEIPTYPYAGERQKGILYWLIFKWDEIYSVKLEKLVSEIITYSRDEYIYHIPTICISNGIIVNEITPVKMKEKGNGPIRLLIVAYMQPHHGYERLLRGIKKYYEKNHNRILKCDFVGEGPEKKYYEALALELGIKEYVEFHGAKNGKELDELYNQADIGICSLGAYKKGVYLSSELKSREYFAKGLPIVSGVTIDLFREKNTEFYLELPNNESDIDMNEIVAFFDRIYNGTRKRTDTIREIRAIAEKYMDMSETMKPVYLFMRRQL